MLDSTHHNMGKPRFALWATLIVALTLHAPSLARAEDEDREHAVRVHGDAAGVRVQAIRLPVQAAKVVNFRELVRQEALRRGPRPPVRPLVHLELEEPVEEDAGIAPAPLGAPFAPFAASPSPTNTFMGLDDIPMVDSLYIIIPPDVGGAVGETRILQGLNNNYRILDKATGAEISTVGTATFWAPTGETKLADLTDPRTLYDPYNHRWIVEMQTVTTGAGSILIGVSQTEDPEGNWYLFRYTGVNATIDFPIMGFNKNWLAVTINRYNNGGSFQRGVTLVVDYPQLLAGTMAPTLFVQAMGTHFCAAPCVTYSTTSDTLYVINHLNSGAATYYVDRITGTPSSPAYTTGATLTRTGGGWITPSGSILPQSAPVSGTSACSPPCKIEAQDSWMRSAPVYRGGFIYYTQTVGLPSSGLTHTAAQWTKITTPSGAFVSGGRIEDPTANATNGGKWYSYPDLAVNAAGDFIVGYSQFSSAQHPAAGYSVHLAGDAAGSIRDPLVYKLGEDYYHKDFGFGRNRWGDFSQAQVDPVDDQTLWVVNEYGKARTSENDGTTGQNGSRWSTYWAQLAFVTLPSVSIAAGPSQGEGDAGTTSFSFTVSLSTASASPVTVRYHTQDGTATGASGDYLAVTDSVIIAPGNTSAPIAISINGDTDCEPDENFTVVLTSAVNASLGAPSISTATILADDSKTITASAGTGGTIAPSGAVFVACFASQGFTITPSIGYHVTDVLVDGISVGPVTAHTISNVTQDHTIAASFAIDAYTLQVSTSNGGGVSRDPDQPSYEAGSVVQLTATPDSGFVFTGWSGDASGTDNPLPLTMDSNKTVTASFADVAPPLVEVTAPDSGEVLLVGAATDITWNAIDNDTVTVVDLLLSRHGLGGPFEPIAGALPNSGAYGWAVSGPASDSALVKIVVHDAATNLGEDVSDSLFTISDPTAADTRAVAALTLGFVQPNPATRSAAVSFALARQAAVRLAIMDVQGREIAVLVSGTRSPGWYSAAWDGRTSTGRAGPGVYFAELTSEGQRVVRRFAWVR